MARPTASKKARTKQKSKKNTKPIKVSLTNKRIFGLFIIGFALVGIAVLVITRAATPGIDSLQPIIASKSAGAKLPISYNISSLSGSIKYASPNGSSSSSCTVSDPCTLSRAVGQVTTANSTVVLRGGVYRGQRNISISGSGKNGLRIVAYPGEKPEIRGSDQVSSSSGWTTEGSYKYRSYTARPVTEGGGVNFTSGNTNLNGDGVGRYPDQVWIGNTPLKEVLSKSSLNDSSFFVDRTNNRLYMTATSSAKSDIESSRSHSGDRDRLFQISSTDVKIEGIVISRFSPTANDYGVITVENSAHNSTLQNVEISNLPYEGVHYGTNNNAVVKNVTMYNIGWQSINANQTDNLLLDAVKITNTDYFDEFSSSPASGALKTSRTRGTKVINSVIDDNKSHGLWFDQSNINTVAYNNAIRDNSGSAIFFEISDGFLLANNYIKSTGSGQPLKLAGSSGLRLVNNTIVGGANPLGVYTDSRSTPGCAKDINQCKSGAGTYSSDRQGRFTPPSTMDWMPRIDYMVNNIFAYPTGSYICGGATAACYMTSHSSTGASAPMNTIIHKSDTARGIPQTYINGNVYATNTEPIIRVTSPSANYSNVSAFTSAMATATGINGIDANSKNGSSWVNSDGTPSSTLASAHSQAVAIPQDAEINKYIPAGTKYYGALATTTASTPTEPAPTTPTNPTPTEPAPVPPTGPTTLNATPASTSQINLTWSAAVDTANLKDYLVYRNSSLIKEGLTSTSFNDTGLTASTSYSYQVKVRNKTDLISQGSPVVSASTQAAPAPTPTPTPTPTPEPTADTTKPTAPSNILRSLVTDWTNFRYNLKLDWTASKDASGIKEYQIFRNGSKLGTSTGTSFTDNTLAAGYLYSYSIVAVDKAGNVSNPGTTSAKANCFLVWCSLE